MSTELRLVASTESFSSLAAAFGVRSNMRRSSVMPSASVRATCARWIGKKGEVVVGTDSSALILWDPIAQLAKRYDLVVSSVAPHLTDPAVQEADGFGWLAMEIFDGDLIFVQRHSNKVLRVSIDDKNPLGAPVLEIASCGPTEIFTLAMTDVRVAVGTAEGTIHVWNVTNGNSLLRIVAAFRSPITAISAWSDCICGGGEDGVVRIWNINDGTLVKTMSTGKIRVSSLVSSQDGELISAGGDDGSVFVWSGMGAKLETLIEDENETVKILSISISNDKKTIAVGSSSKTLRIYGGTGFAPKLAVGFNDHVTAVKFTDGLSAIGRVGFVFALSSDGILRTFAPPYTAPEAAANDQSSVSSASSPFARRNKSSNASPHASPSFHQIPTTTTATTIAAATSPVDNNRRTVTREENKSVKFMDRQRGPSFRNEEDDDDLVLPQPAPPPVPYPRSGKQSKDRGGVRSSNMNSSSQQQQVENQDESSPSLQSNQPENDEENQRRQQQRRGVTVTTLSSSSRAIDENASSRREPLSNTPAPILKNFGNPTHAVTLLNRAAKGEVPLAVQQGPLSLDAENGEENGYLDRPQINSTRWMEMEKAKIEQSGPNVETVYQSIAPLKDIAPADVSKLLSYNRQEKVYDGLSPIEDNPTIPETIERKVQMKLDPKWKKDLEKVPDIFCIENFALKQEVRPRIRGPPLPPPPSTLPFSSLPTFCYDAAVFDSPFAPYGHKYQQKEES